MEFGLPIELCQIILRFRTQLIYKDVHTARIKMGWKQVHDELLNEHDVYFDETKRYIPPRIYNYGDKRAHNKWNRYSTSNRLMNPQDNLHLLYNSENNLMWITSFGPFCITDFKGQWIDFQKSSSSSK